MNLSNVLIETILSQNLCDELVEGAVNDFSKKISRGDKFFFLLAGSPRSGKSTIVNKYILPRQRNIQIVNPDDISLLFTKDPNIYKSGATRLSNKRAKSLLKNRKDNASFVYDSTGYDNKRLKTLSDEAKKEGYKVVLLSVFTPLKTALKRNKESERNVDQDYLIDRWKQAQENISVLSKYIKPYLHFIVVSMNERDVWYEYKQGKIKR